MKTLISKLNTAKILLTIAALATLAPLPALASVTLGQANLSAISTGLVGYWPLDGVTTNWKTGITSDISGQGNNGSLISMSTTTSPTVGKIGQALKFNGSTSLIDTGVQVIPDNSTYTASAWVKINPSAAGSIISQDVDSGHKKWAVNILSNGKVDLTYVNIGGTYQFDDTVASPVTAGAWHHVVAVHNESTLKETVYVDGVSYPLSSNTFPNSIGPGVTSLRMGIDRQTGNFPGSLDDVRIYNRALSPQEVVLLYALGNVNIDHANTVSLSSGLVGYWPFDGSTINWKTGTISDISGFASSGIPVSLGTTTAPTIGKIGEALNFNGNNYVLVSSLPTGLTGSNLTEAVWVKLSTSNDTYVLDLGSGAANNNWIEVLNTRKIRSGSNAAGYCDSTTVLSIGKWYHIVRTYSGTTNSVYINGILDCSSSQSATSPARVVIGADGALDSSFRFTGTIDDVRVYNRALSPQEVADLYAEGSAGTNVDHSNTVTLSTGLVGYWPFDGNTINWKTNTFSDISGQGNNATSTGLGTTTSPTIGKIGQALKLVSSHLDIPSASSLNLTTGATISFWAKPSAVAVGQVVSKNTAVVATTPYEIQFWNDGFVYGNFSTSGGNIVNNKCAYVANTWYHVVSTFDGANAKLYLNGVRCSSVAGSGTINTNSSDLFIGASGTASPFKGTLDDVRVYNRALSAQEVQQLYQMGK